jgi:hypothetical protein
MKTKLEKIFALSNNELNIKVAELAGWKPKFLGYEKDDGQLGRSQERYSKMPDYSVNLNAMHEIEEKLGNLDKYIRNLRLVTDCEPHAISHLIRANARERAQAYVLTMSEKK